LLARKSLLLFITQAFNSALGLVSTFVVAHVMGPDALGTIGYLLGVVGLISFLSDLGFSFSHRKRTSEVETLADTAVLIGTYWTINLLFLTPLIALVIVLLPLAAQVVGHALLTTRDQQVAYYIIAMTLVLTNLGRPALVTFQAREQSAKGSWVSLVSSFATAVAKIFVAVTGLGIVALSVAFLLESVVSCTVALWLFRGYPIRRPTWAHIRDYVKYAAPITMGGILGNMYNLDRILLERAWGVTEVGYYTAPVGAPTVINHVSESAMSLFFPRTSRDAASDNLDTIRDRLFGAEKFLLLVTTPMAALLIYYNEPITRLALGTKFLSSAPVLAILALVSLCTVYVSPYTNVIIAIEKQSHLLTSILLKVTIMLAVDLVLVPRELGGLRLFGLGSTGAALGLLAGTIANLLHQVYVTARFIRVGLYLKAGWFVVAGTALCLTLFIVDLPGMGIASTIIGLPLSLVVYVGTLVALKQLSRQDMVLMADWFNPRRMMRYISSEMLPDDHNIQRPTGE